jgi:hypothetical protein
MVKENMPLKKSRMGFDPDEWKTDGVGKGRAGVLPKKEPRTPEKSTATMNNTPQHFIEARENAPQEKLIATTFYITKRQKNAIVMKRAMSDRVEDKDQSAMVRFLLDNYLADILKQIA